MIVGNKSRYTDYLHSMEVPKVLTLVFCNQILCLLVGKKSTFSISAVAKRCARMDLVYSEHLYLFIAMYIPVNFIHLSECKRD